jgi:hypothetical protein
MMKRIRMPESNGEQVRKPSGNWVAFGRQLLGTVQAILGTLATGMVFLIVFRATQTPLIYGFSLAVAIGIGLVGGLYLRLILRKSLDVIRLLAGLVAALCGLVAFDLALTLGEKGSGVSVLPGWILILQTIVTGFCVGLALNAWSKTRLKKLNKLSQVRRARHEKQRKLKEKKRQKVTHGRTQAVHTSTRAQSMEVLRVQPKPKTETYVPAKKRRSKKVTLARFEEHRCPYCLEEVKTNDPRGVKICSVCGAWHHQDCWDITGHCQVPHSGNAHV